MVFIVSDSILVCMMDVLCKDRRERFLKRTGLSHAVLCSLTAQYSFL